MSTENDWSHWQQQWQRQAPMPDIEHLQRQVRRKHGRMVAVAIFEALASIFALVQLVRLQLMPHLPLRWHVAGAAMFGFLVVLQCFVLHVRRGTWRLATADSRSLLQLSARRARAGMRLAWLQVWGLLVLLVMVAMAAWPWLQPERWQHDAHLRMLLALQIGINGPIVIGGLTLCCWYIRRQRRRLQQLEAWLRE